MILGMVAMPVEQFEELVANALDGIPAELGAAMENVALVVDDHSPLDDCSASTRAYL